MVKESSFFQNKTPMKFLSTWIDGYKFHQRKRARKYKVKTTTSWGFVLHFSTCVQNSEEKAIVVMPTELKQKPCWQRSFQIVCKIACFEDIFRFIGNSDFRISSLPMAYLKEYGIVEASCANQLLELCKSWFPILHKIYKTLFAKYFNVVVSTMDFLLIFSIQQSHTK